MALPKLNDNLNAHQSLPDNPNLSTTDLKIKWDEPVNKIKAFINDVLTGAIDTLLGNKVDKVTGKGLSTSDYTAAEKTKLANIEDGATKVTTSTTAPTGGSNGDKVIQLFD